MLNKSKKYIFLLSTLFILINSSIYGQMDKIFWFVAPKITLDNCVGPECPSGEPMYLNIGTVDFESDIVVDMPATGDTLAVLTIPGQSGASIDLTPFRALIEASNAGWSQKGIRITSTTLVTVYYELYDSRNSGMYTLKGLNGLGKNFVVPSQNLWDNDLGYDPDPIHAIYIVATENGTQVEFTPSYDAVGFPAGGTYTTPVLNKGESYAIFAQSNLGVNHLGGTVLDVVAGGNIAVMVSDDSVGPGGKKTINGDQLIPITLIGDEYLVMMGASANETAFIIPTVDGTQIELDGVLQGVTLNVGDNYAIPLVDHTHIKATNPIYVYHASGFQAMGGAVLPSINGCTGSHEVTVFRPRNQPFFMNVMVSTAAKTGFRIKYADGTDIAVDPAWFDDVYGEWSVINVPKQMGDQFNVGEVTKLYNTINVFHLGVVATVAANTTQYGYFSDYGINAAEAEEVSTGWKYPSVCFGDSIQLTARGGTSYEWYNEITGGAEYLSDPLIASPVLTNIPVGLYKYAVIISGPCAQDTLSIFIEIKEGVTAFFQIDDPNGCAPHSIQIDNLTAAANDFRWDFDGDGIYDLITGDSAAVTGRIYDNTTLSDTSYNITLLAKNKFSCTDKFSRYVYVFPEIIAGFDQDFDSGCNPLDVQFTDTSSGNLNQNYWDFGDGYIAVDSIDPFHIYENVNSTDTIFTVTLINTSPYNCKDTATKDITVNPYIEARFAVDKNVGCAPFDVIVNNLSRGGITTYSWDYDGDGVEDSNTSAASFTIPYTNATAAPIDYTLRLVVKNANNCTDTLERIIRVYPIINADYVVDVSEGCNSLDVVFTNNSTGASLVDWDFGDGISSNSTAATINHTYNNYFTHDTIFGFSLHVESDYGCNDDTTGNITVYRTFADFKIDTAEGCSPLNVNITNTSVGSNLSYEWIFGDGTANDITNNPVSHTYNNTGGITDNWNLELKLEGNGGCRDSLTLPIIVYSEVTAAFTPTNIVGCDSTVVIFDNTSSAWATIYDWSFGDATYSNQFEPTHTYRNSSGADVVYKTQLSVITANGCQDSISTNVTIHPFVKADFAVDPSEGCSPFTLDVEAVSYTGNGTYNWDFKNGNTPTGINPAVQTYINTSGVTDNYSIELSVIDVSGNCHDTLILPIQVFSESKAEFTPMPDIGCNPFDVNFISSVLSFNASLFNWDFGDGSSSNLADPSHSFVNTTNLTKPFTVNLGVTSLDGCTHDTSTTISVYPYVNADFDINVASGCSPLDVQVTNNSKGGNYRWYWNSVDGSGVEDSTSANSGEIFNHIYINNSGVDQTVYLTLIAENANNCTDTLTRTIVVHSAMKAQFVSLSGTEDCTPFMVSFDNQTDPLSDAEYFTWDFDDGTTGNSTKASPDISHEFVNTTDADITYTVTLEAESPYGCVHDTTLNITVYRRVIADFDINTNEGCSPLDIEITNKSKGGNYRWYWDSTDGSGIADYPSVNSSEIFNHIYINNSGVAQTVYLTLIAENAGGCADTLTKTIVVHSAIKAQFISLSGTEDCAPFMVSFDNQTDPLSDAEYFTWDFGDGTTGNSTKASPDISHEFVNTTDADITYIVTLEAESPYGCVHDTTLNITVYRRVIADFDINIDEGCSPLDIEITNKSRGGTYDWYWHDAPMTVADLTTNDVTTNPILHTYNNASQTDVIQNLTVIAQNGHAACNEILKKAVTIHSSVVADFTISDAANCNPLTTTFSPTVPTDADNFYWYYSDGTSEITTAGSPNATHVFNNPETNDKPFQIKMIAETMNGCLDSIQQNVTVYSYLEAHFAMESSTGCPPFTTTIENTSFGNAANTYEWLVNGNPEFNSTGLADFTHTYDNVNPTKLDYDILLHAENSHGCVSEYTGTITVAEEVEAIFSMTSNGCSPLDVTFTNSSIAPSGTIYLWDFKDGSTSTLDDPSITHRFFNPGRENDITFNVELALTSPSYCTDKTSALVTVYHQPLAQFYIDKTASCPPLVSTMDDLSEGHDSFEWRFGDGATDNVLSSVSHTYENTGSVVLSYELELYVETNQGCKDSTALMLNVYPEVTADFTYDVSGCSPFVSQFNSTSQNASYYSWNFDDGNTSNQKNPTNRYDNIWYTDLVYQVNLKASSEYNCWDTITKPVTVYVQPIAEFDVSPIVQKFPENRVFIDNLTEHILGPWNYLWEFGDFDASTSAVAEPNYFDYEHWGEKEIKLTVNSQTSNCTDNITKFITILPPDINADFTTTIDGGCLNDGLEVQFAAASAVYSEVYNYTWDFGDGSGLAYGSNVTHTYENAGVYYVKMTATGEGGEDFEYKTIKVYSNPTANFEVMPKLAMLDEVSLEARIEYYNLSVCNDTAGCSYLWDFGDGSTAISRDVTHSYSELGKYDVKLTVTSANGCSDSLLLIEEIEIIGAGQIVFPNAFTPNGDGLNDTFRPVSQGVIKYEMLLYNRWGELIFTTKDLSAGWDGKIKGKWAKTDVYIWKAEGKFTNGKAFEIAGDVTLIK